MTSKNLQDWREMLTGAERDLEVDEQRLLWARVDLRFAEDCIGHSRAVAESMRAHVKALEVEEALKEPSIAKDFPGWATP